MNYKKKSFLNSINRPTSRLIAKLRKMTDRLSFKRNKSKDNFKPKNDASNLSI